MNKRPFEIQLLYLVVLNAELSEVPFIQNLRQSWLQFKFSGLFVPFWHVYVNRVKHISDQRPLEGKAAVIVILL